MFQNGGFIAYRLPMCGEKCKVIVCSVISMCTVQYHFENPSHVKSPFLLPSRATRVHSYHSLHIPEPTFPNGFPYWIRNVYYARGSQPENGD
jgi:hypothetical protein